MSSEHARSPEAAIPGLYYCYQFFYEDPRIVPQVSNPQSLRILDQLATAAQDLGNRRAFKHREGNRDMTIFEFNTRAGIEVNPRAVLAGATVSMLDWLSESGLEDVTFDRVEVLTMAYGKQIGEREDNTIEARTTELMLQESRQFNPDKFTL